MFSYFLDAPDYMVWLDVDNTLYASNTKIAQLMTERIYSEWMPISSLEFYLFNEILKNTLSMIWEWTKNKHAFFIVIIIPNTVWLYGV